MPRNKKSVQVSNSPNDGTFGDYLKKFDNGLPPLNTVNQNVKQFKPNKIKIFPKRDVKEILLRNLKESQKKFDKHDAIAPPRRLTRKDKAQITLRRKLIIKESYHNH